MIKETEAHISDCVTDVILKPAKAKLRVVNGNGGWLHNKRSGVPNLFLAHRSLPVFL
ncbi:MAG: hypothetical protein K2L07_13155 [Lachnospiraceae bacterium]|nr:hypothetical protein [Lachnospiraceae bacterium]